MEFDDIRPYTDEEFREAKGRILNGPEFGGLVYVLSSIYCAGKSTDSDVKSLRKEIGQQIGDANTVKDFQGVIDEHARRVMDKTISHLSQGGLENVVREDNRGFLFISNHRDIAMDYLIANRILHSNGYERAMGAAGSNLLVSSIIGELLKLYNCFIVKRDPSGVQKQRDRHQKKQDKYVLSSYIYQLITGGHSIWLAQREGRAKDGNDETNPNLIRMLCTAQEIDGASSFSDYINALNIVPISVSYQYDPSDVLKVKELLARKLDPEYTKSGHEDKKNIFFGIAGAKGNVRISFGKPLRGDFSSPRAVARAIDEQIQGQYYIWDTNEMAYCELFRDSRYAPFMRRYPDDVQTGFFDRFAKCSPEEKEIALGMYARPLANKLKVMNRANY